MDNSRGIRSRDEMLNQLQSRIDRYRKNIVVHIIIEVALVKPSTGSDILPDLGRASEPTTEQVVP